MHELLTSVSHGSDSIGKLYRYGAVSGTYDEIGEILKKEKGSAVISGHIPPVDKGATVEVKSQTGTVGMLLRALAEERKWRERQFAKSGGLDRTQSKFDSPKLTKLGDEDDIQDYLTTFEQMMVAFEIDRN